MAKVLFGEGEGFYTSDFKKYANIEDFLTVDPMDPLAQIFRWENVHYDCSVGHKKCLVSKSEFLSRVADNPVTFRDGDTPYLINTHVYDYNRSMNDAVTAINVPEVPVIIATKKVQPILQMIGDNNINGVSINVIMGMAIESIDTPFKNGSIYIVSCN